VKVVLDTNIYISALISGGRPLLLIQMLAQDTDSEIFFSDAILEETVRVLKDKFTWSPEDIHDAETLFTKTGLKIETDQTLDAVPDDPDDNRILECAVAAQADFIATGDNDLLRLGVFRGIRILRPAELLQVIHGET
jgi:uncharacterized protein